VCSRAPTLVSTSAYGYCCTMDAPRSLLQRTNESKTFPRWREKIVSGGIKRVVSLGPTDAFPNSICIYKLYMFGSL